MSDPSPQSISFTPVPANDPDLVLGEQALNLCQLSYCNAALTKDAELEKEWKEKARVWPEDYTLWTEHRKALSGWIYKRFINSQCITGVVRTAENTKVPFVVFRGSVSAKDWGRDFMSIVTEVHVTKKGNKLGEKGKYGKVGKGFRQMLIELQEEKRPGSPSEGKSSSKKQSATSGSNPMLAKESTSETTGSDLMDEILRLVRKYDSGLIICGHSLGGACANIFLLELALDYRQIIDNYGRNIRMVTFGSPRAVSPDVARFLDALPITYLRFVNNDDLVTGLPPESITTLTHAGKAFYPYLPSQLDEVNSKNNPLLLKDWDNQTPEERKQTHWLVVRDGANGIADFGADGKADNQSFWWWSSPLPRAFLKRVASHSVVSEQGYNQHFENYKNALNPNEKETGAIADDMAAGTSETPISSPPPANEVAETIA